MNLRCVCLSIFLCLALRPTVKAQVEVKEQGYQNVLISFSPNVPSENGRELVKTVEELLESTSDVLQTAIGIRIATATFLLPPSWSTDTWEDKTINVASSEQTARKPDIRVDHTEQSPFGKQPVALQHGGCGVPGHQITLPLDFLSSTDDYPRGKLLAREWLKYRYGVFEENGFKYDDLYPDYYRVPGSTDIRITECTDSDVKYKFKNPSNGEECTVMDRESEFGYCRAHPDEESAANVTSSLMYFHHELQNMEHICGKDDHPHNNTTLSKQNVLCNGQSIWDVVQLSKDFEKTEEVADPAPDSIQFSYIQESKPRFVVLLENSDNLVEKELPIHLALRRFYYDLPSKSKLAIYTIDSNATETLSYDEIPAQERSDLGAIADFGLTLENVCTSCGLVKATNTLLSESEVAKGSILLITASPLDAVPELSEKLKASGICLNVLRFAGEGDDVDTSYEPLRNDPFSCYSYDQISYSLENLEIFKSLFSFLKKPLLEFKEDFETKTVLSEMMSAENPVTIPEDAMASLYTLWLGKVFTSNSIQCKAGETDVPLTAGTKGTDIASFTFQPVKDTITCRLVSTKQQAIMTQVQMTTQKGHYFDFDIWTHDESTDTEQLPIIIYAKIYFGGYPVKDARVTAVVTSDSSKEIVMEMLDNGGGNPDITRYDGVYSGYFISFETAGKYQITVKIDDNKGNAKIGKEYPELMSATCCGSKVVSEDADIPAFQMEKTTEYTARNKTPEDGYPPSRIVDLRVGIFNSSHFAVLTWTAPGGEKASSYQFYAFCDLEDCEDGRLPNWLKLNQTEPKPKSYGEPEEAVILFTPEIPKIENLTLFFAIKSVSEKGKLSDLSNKAEIFQSLSPEPNTTIAPITKDGRKLATSDKTGIIVGSVITGIFLLLCLGALLYFYVFKPRRAKPSNIDASGYFQDKKESDTEVSGSFRAVPIRDRGSMRRVESFPVLLYTHDQLKDFKKKVDPPLYKPAIAPRPWMSMNVLSNSELKRGGDSKSIGSASTLPMNDKHRSNEMKQLDDVSIASETPHPEETIKF